MVNNHVENDPGETNQTILMLIVTRNNFMYQFYIL